MLRIRKKLTLILCGVCIALFLFLYILLNFAIPIPADKQLENGLHQHRKEIAYSNKEIDPISVSINGKQNDYDNIILKQNENQINNPKFGVLNNKEMYKDLIINANEFSKCPAITETVPQPDIQMMDLYTELPFDNLDGGPWKQGWRINIDPMEFNKHHKLKVFVVPHSHNDPGWLKTFDDYYEHDTKQILSNAVRHLTENPSMKFIWAEISYFSRFYEPLSEVTKTSIKKLVKNRQLEFVTGGWVMPDEANSHWMSILMQLTEGQTWLRKYLNITPTSSWAIDPFGHSPTLPYILKNSDFQNLLIQRTHYSVKKQLAHEKQLEFRWRQIWDDNGDTDLFTHMMPFYSYDIPHTCGPDPKICCQFDFKRLPRFGLTCPWHVAPQPIDDLNVAKKAEIIVDQWRKKSTLYKTRSVLIPLGDDFRYSQSTEWESQRINYEKLFDYINNEPNLHTEAKFGTLQEYFDSVRHEKGVAEFPSLSGDFFTYSDRDDHYWSGYYTSRPFHKRMDRVLLHYIRSAEMLRSWHSWKPEFKMNELLENARRQLSLFQHHDGVTGTAKNDVVIDYARRMMEAIKDCRQVMQQSVYRLLTKPNNYVPDYKFTYFHMDDTRWPGPDDGRMTIVLGHELPIKHIVFHNSLPKWREELVEVLISNPFVRVTDFEMKKIPAQISPYWSWHKGFSSITVPQASTTKFRLIFKVKIPPLGLATYLVHSEKQDEEDTGISYSKNTILTTAPFSVNLGEYPVQVEFAEPRDISITVSANNLIAAFNKNGLLKSIALNSNSPHISTHLEFLKYGTRSQNGMSGAYLFLPDGPASSMILGGPTVLLTQGELESSVTTGLPFATHSTILRDGNFVEIRNLVNIGQMDNTEIVMRIKTGIKSNDIFYTDLNGLQIIKRKRFSKLPLQANYYPIPTTMYIEDQSTRLTLLTSTPLGGSSLQSGEFEIMQDRRLAQDDQRGLAQGVLDNQPVLHIFRLILENRNTCTKRLENYPSGFLTAQADNALSNLLYPVNKFIWNDIDWIDGIGVFGKNNEPVEDGIEVNVLKNLEYLSSRDSAKSSKSNIGIVIHRKQLEECSTDKYREGVVNIKQLLNLQDDFEIHSTTVTFLRKIKRISNVDINFCPMDLKAFIIKR